MVRSRPALVLVAAPPVKSAPLVCRALERRGLPLTVEYPDGFLGPAAQVRILVPRARAAEAQKALREMGILEMGLVEGRGARER